MKNFAFAGIFAFLLTGIIAIGGTWSYVTNVSPAVGADSTSTPNPLGIKK
jgi:hypothetical protein